MNEASWFDTTLFAPKPIEEIERDGAVTRPDIRFVQTPHARIRLRAQIEAGKPAVVLFPDGPNTIEQHDAVFDVLRGKYSVVAVEPPGLGFSYARHPAVLDFEGTIDALVLAIDALALDRMIFAGACVQAYVAIALATRFGKRTLGVIASQATDLAGQKAWTRSQVDPAGFLRVPHVGQQAWLNPRTRETLSIDAWYKLAAGPGADVSSWQSAARQAIRCGACYGLASLVQNWFGEADIPIPTWTGPGVILFGLADKTHRRAGSRPDGLLAYAPNAEVRQLERIGHFPDLEALGEFEDAIRKLADA